MTLRGLDLGKANFTDTILPQRADNAGLSLYTASVDGVNRELWFKREYRAQIEGRCTRQRVLSVSCGAARFAAQDIAQPRSLFLSAFCCSTSFTSLQTSVCRTRFSRGFSSRSSTSGAFDQLRGAKRGAGNVSIYQFGKYGEIFERLLLKLLFSIGCVRNVLWMMASNDVVWAFETHSSKTCGRIVK